MQVSPRRTTVLDWQPHPQYTLPRMKNLIKKCLWATLLCSISAVSLAAVRGNVATPGFYLNVEYGYGTANYQTNFAPGFVAQSVNKSGAATRIIAGYDFTRYVGALFSVVYMKKPLFNNINGTTTSAFIKNNIVLTALKLNWPISRRFLAHGDLGIGYIVRGDIVLNGTTALPPKEIVTPVYGIGLAYLLFTRWSITASWLQAPKNSSEQVPSSNFVGGGIQYKFAT